MPSIHVIDNTDVAERDVGKILGEPNAEMQAIIGIWEGILKRNFAGYPNVIEKLKEFFLARFTKNSLKEQLQSSLLEEHLKGYAPTEKNQIINNVLSFYENLQIVFTASSAGPVTTHLKSLTTKVLAALKVHLISTVGITSLVHLWAALKLGYAIHLQTGITQGLPYGHPLLEMLKNVWTTCVSQVHPYQIGPTNQGTEHSMHNLETLNIINSLPSLDMTGVPPLPNAPRNYISSIPPKQINMEEGALLSAAAALHDIGKAVRDPKTFSHEEIGYKFICANRTVFGIPEDTLASAIAEIVLNHDGKRILNSENIFDSPINYRNRSTMADPIRTREVCALFRLVGMPWGQSYTIHFMECPGDERLYILDLKNVYGPDFLGETFRVLKGKEEKQYGEYRTRRLVVEAWDRLETK